MLGMKNLSAIALLILSSGPVSAQLNFLGAVSPERLRDSAAYTAYAQTIGATLPEVGPGTELSLVVNGLFGDAAEQGGALDQIASIRGGAGYGVFVPRFEHDVVEIRLLDGSSVYATRVYTTVILDIFADRGAFSTARRLESVYSRGAAHVSVFPGGSAARRPPSAADLNFWYRLAFEGALNEMRAAIEADEVSFRRRAFRVFRVEPVLLSSQSAEFLNEIGWISDADSAHLLVGELAYMLHISLQANLLERGLDQIALLPPSLEWATGSIARLLEDRLPSGAALISEPEDMGRLSVSVQVELQRAGVVTGESNQLGEQRVAATRISGWLERGGSRLGTEEPAPVGRGGEPYLAIVGVPPTAVRGAWRESFLSATRQLSPEIAARITAANESIE